MEAYRDVKGGLLFLFHTYHVVAIFCHGCFFYSAGFVVIVVLFSDLPFPSKIMNSSSTSSLLYHGTMKRMIHTRIRLISVVISIKA